MGILNGQVALITGGSRGIGRAIGLAFAAEGADIAFCHLDTPEQAQATAEAIVAMGRRVLERRFDVTDTAAARAFVAETEAALGPVDVLVNNAGMNIRRDFADYTEEEYDRILSLHLRATFFMAQTVYRSMVARQRGKIINIASQRGLKGEPGAVPYAAAKAGVIGFTRALALEAAPECIRVNAIAPGPVDTDMLRRNDPAALSRFRETIPARRFGTPEEIAATALLLAGPHGDFYIGACLSPNGGDVLH